MAGSKFLARVSLQEARNRLLADLAPVEAETVPTQEAEGRVLSETVFAAHDAPHYRASAMDGVALRAADSTASSPESPIELLALTDLDAEPPPHAAVCVPVDTGGVLPAWADAVIRIEEAEATGDGFRIRTPVEAGHDVRRAGEDVDAGAMIARAGRRLEPWDLGVLLATGVLSVSVVRRPRLAILATGSEVIEPVADPRAGQVIEYNGHMLSAAARRWGAEATMLGIVPDDRDALSKWIGEAAQSFDAVAVIAGSSVGRKDLTVEILEELGTLLFHGVDIMPGKPASGARIQGTPVVGIPGYPVSAIVVYEQLVHPLLAALQGTQARSATKMSARVGRKIPSRLGVEEFRRVALCCAGDDFVVAPLPRGAGSLSTVVHAHAWLRIPATSEGLDAGASVQVELRVDREQIRRTLVVAGPYDAALLRLACDPEVDVELVFCELAPFDAVEALAAGEAHLALLAEDAGLFGFLEARLPSAVVSGSGGDGVRAVTRARSAENTAIARALAAVLGAYERSG